MDRSISKCMAVIRELAESEGDDCMERTDIAKIAFWALIRDDKQKDAILDAARQLYDRPVWDGEVPPKTGRDFLLEHGLAIRIIIAGAQGFTAMTHFGYTLLKDLVLASRE